MLINISMLSCETDLKIFAQYLCLHCSTDRLFANKCFLADNNGHCGGPGILV